MGTAVAQPQVIEKEVGGPAVQEADMTALFLPRCPSCHAPHPLAAKRWIDPEDRLIAYRCACGTDYPELGEPVYVAPVPQRWPIRLAFWLIKVLDSIARKV